MKCIGMNFQKGKFRIVELEKDTGGHITFNARSIVKVDPELEFTELMDRYRRDFVELIDHSTPDLIAARQVFDTGDLAGANFQASPVAILGLVAKQKKTPLKLFTPAGLRHPGPFGLPKTEKPLEAVDKYFGTHNPNWDNIHKAALLVAWRALLEA